MKPEDFGEDTITLNVDNNDAWACADIEVTENEENQRTEPEMEVDDTADPSSNMDGELAGEIELFLWADDGDNVYEQDETPLIEEGDDDNKVTFERFIDGVSYPIADSEVSQMPDTATSGALQGGQDYHIGKAWCFGELTPNAVADDSDDNPADRGESGFTCNGSEVGNDTQTDIVEGNVGFRAVQSRNNSDFTCEFPEDENGDERGDITSTPRDTWSKATQDKDWIAKGRYGDNLGTTGSYELEVGDQTQAGRDTGNYEWIDNEPSSWTLTYDATSSVATFEVDGVTVSQNVMSPDANSFISVIAKTSDSNDNGTTATVENIQLDGISPTGGDSVSAETTGGSREISSLDIQGDLELTDGFTLTGDTTFDWGSNPDEEGPAFEIVVGQPGS